MIKTRADLEFYLTEDFKRYNLSRWHFLHRLFGLEQATIWHIQRRFRIYEWALNNRTSLLGKIRYLYCYWRYQRLSLKYGVHLWPNIIGYGFKIVHIGGGILTNCNRIGNYCTITSGVKLGNKDSDAARPYIGDNTSLGIDAKAFGNVHIGNNVFVAPGSIVTHDIPDDVIVAGIPAKIIKKK